MLRGRRQGQDTGNGAKGPPPGVARVGVAGLEGGQQQTKVLQVEAPVVPFPHSVSQTLMSWTHGSLQLFSLLLLWAGPKRYGRLRGRD